MHDTRPTDDGCVSMVRRIFPRPDRRPSARQRLEPRPLLRPERPRECIAVRKRKRGAGASSATLNAAKRQLALWPADGMLLKDFEADQRFWHIHNKIGRYFAAACWIWPCHHGRNFHANTMCERGRYSAPDKHSALLRANSICATTTTRSRNHSTHSSRALSV
jgi:hypothetical protein